MRDNTKVTQNTTISGIQTGDYFIVYDSNITHSHVGSGITALDEGGNVIGVGTTFIDNIYRVADHVAITTSAIGYGVTAVRRVTVSVEDFSGVGVGTSVFAGRFSWGKIVFSERVGVATYGAITNNGVVGIRTGPYITRQQSLKSIGFVT